jgi:hypothetical protein
VFGHSESVGRITFLGNLVYNGSLIDWNGSGVISLDAGDAERRKRFALPACLFWR